MLLHVYNKFRLGRSLLPGPNQSATKLAYALAFGLMLGIIPKGNLVAAAIATIILATTVHKSMAILTTFLVALGSGLIDPLTHRIGHAILTYEGLQTTWTYLFELPLVAWTGLNNTVVMGGSVVGVVVFLPAYRLSKPLFQRYWVKTTSDATEDAPTPSEPPSELTVLNDPDRVAVNELAENERAAKKQVAQIAAELELHRRDILPISAGHPTGGPHGLPLRPISTVRRFAAVNPPEDDALAFENEAAFEAADPLTDHNQQAIA